MRSTQKGIAGGAGCLAVPRDIQQKQSLQVRVSLDFAGSIQHPLPRGQIFRSKHQRTTEEAASRAKHNLGSLRCPGIDVGEGALAVVQRPFLEPAETTEPIGG